MLGIAVEALVELLTESYIFKGLRERVTNPFLSKLFSCAYCMSVWVSLFVCLPVAITLNLPWVISIVCILVAHRLSNFFHDVFGIAFYKNIDSIGSEEL